MERFIFASIITVFLFSCAVEPKRWQPIGSLPHEGAMEHFFEMISTGDPCDCLDGWKALSGDQNARASIAQGEGRAAGDKAIHVSYEFVGKEGLEYVAVVPVMPIEKPGGYLGVWAKGVGDGGVLRFRVTDSKGETHQGDLGRIKNDRWQFCVAPIRDSSGAWGGDGNKKLDFPCTLQSILLDRPEKGYKGKGALVLDGLSLMRRREAPKELIRVSVPEGHFGNVFLPDETVVLRVERTGAAGDGKVDVAYRLVDFWGAECAKGGFDVGVEGHELRLEPPGRGWFACILEARLDGAPVEAREARLAIMDPPVPLAEVKESFVAMQAHYRGTSWPIESMALFARAGMKYLRDEMSWSSLEKEKGVFEFPSRYDEYVDFAVSLGIEPMIILDYANPLYDGGNFPTSDEAVAGFARYCHEVAERYRGKIRYYEVWNEWSGGCGMHGKTGNTPENYARLIAAAYPAIKKANPDAVVVGIGGEHSKHHLGQIEAMFKAGALKHMDAVSVHPYRYPGTPEKTDLIGEVLTVKKLIEKHGGKQNIWITEIGWPTHIVGQGCSEDDQARVLVRMYIQMMSTGVVDRVFWYDFKDDGLDRFYNENNFGIVRHQQFNCAPKPAYVAYAVMSRFLTNAKFVGGADLGQGALAYRFRRPDGSRLLVAWSPEGECEVKLAESVLRVTDIMGNNRKHAGSSMKLTPDPVYLELQEE